MTTQQFVPDVNEGQVLRIEIEDTKASAEPSSLAHRTVMGSTMVAAAATSVAYNTNGWDTVYVIPLPDVNRAIADKKTSPASWSGHLDADPDGIFPAFNAGGGFGTWSLATGGSGSIIRMHIPFTATVTAGTGAPVNVTGGEAYIEVKLAYIPQATSPDGTEPNKLQVRTTGGSPDDPVVTVTSVTYNPLTGHTWVANVLQQILQQWFNANLDQFQHVFATVNLGQEEASGDFKWLNPTETDYAYIDNADINKALLGVLCMTENRSSLGAVQEIAAGSIPPGSRASFNMSLERFMSKMVLPSLPAEFPHAGTNVFQLGNNDTQIAATSGFDLDPVSVAGTNYTPAVTSYRMTLNGSTMETYLYIHTPISPGIDAYCEITYYNTMALATKSDGSQSLTWIQAQPTDKKTWYTVASGLVIAEVVIDTILAVIGAVVSGIVATVERVIVRVLIGLLVGGVVAAVAKVLELTPEWIAGSVPDAVPSVNALVDGATKTTRWADSTDFKITEVVLNGGLQLGGNPFDS
ncbi:TULIP family P47-like protein [Streptomyces sp. NPDC001817]|uniref:TULIP family P47-like protein n=1 Tax=Streptomyces sp. NPDC001817 TaxID=3154398 RepID=UPI00331B6AD0